MKKYVSLLLVCLFSSFVFAGCSNAHELKKVSKNLTSYAIVATLDDDTKTFVCEEEVCYVNDTGSVLNEIKFNLYPAAFSEDAKIKPYAYGRVESCFPNGISYGDIIIEKVMIDESVIEHQIAGEDNNVLEVNLNEGLNDGEKIVIKIIFKLILANCAHRLGFNDDTINLGNWYPVIAVREEDDFVTDPYYANGDPFYSCVANYDVTIVYPEQYSLVSSGELVNSKIENGNKIEKYTALAVRDFAMCFGKNFISKTSEVGDCLVSVYAYNGDPNIDVYLNTALKSVELFNNFYGEYPYKTLNVVFTEFFQGGMEYPNLVYISDSVSEQEEIKKVIVHEIAHQWWYGLVGNDEVRLAWFDEGLAEFSTMLYFEQHPEEGVDAAKMLADAKVNLELYDDVMGSLNLPYNKSMELALNEYKSEYEYVYMVYVKGLLFFNALRESLGSDVFFDCIKKLFNEYKFKIITKEGFIDVLNNVSGLSLNEQVEMWLSGQIEVS